MTRDADPGKSFFDTLRGAVLSSVPALTALVFVVVAVKVFRASMMETTTTVAIVTNADLFALLKSLAQSKCPFANLPSSKTGHWGEGITAEDMTAVSWVKPKIVVEVSFVEWTRDGLLRHPEFISVRDDKSPREVRREDA